MLQYQSSSLNPRPTLLPRNKFMYNLWPLEKSWGRAWYTWSTLNDVKVSIFLRTVHPQLSEPRLSGPSLIQTSFAAKVTSLSCWHAHNIDALCNMRTRTCTSPPRAQRPVWIQRQATARRQSNSIAASMSTGKRKRVVLSVVFITEHFTYPNHPLPKGVRITEDAL